MPFEARGKEDASISGASFSIIEVYGYDVQIEEAEFKKLRTVQALFDACVKK